MHLYLTQSILGKCETKIKTQCMHKLAAKNITIIIIRKKRKENEK